MADRTNNTEILGMPSVSRKITATTTLQFVSLSKGCMRFSIRPVAQPIRVYLFDTTKIADGQINNTLISASIGHYLGADEIRDFSCFINTRIAYIRETAASADVSVEISELI